MHGLTSRSVPRTLPHCVAGILMLAALAGSNARAQEVGVERALADAGTAARTPPPVKRKGHRHNDPGIVKPGNNKKFLGELLNDDLSQYTAKSFIRELDGPRWLGWDWSRKCVNTRKCDAGELDGRMRMQAIADANHVPASGPLGTTHRVVVARMMNVGNETDLTTGIPHRLRADEYYLIFHRLADRTVLELAIVKRNQLTGAYNKINFYGTDPDALNWCAHPPREHALGSFASCKTQELPDNEDDDTDIDEGVTASSTVRGHVGQSHPLIGGDDELDANAWFSCNDGCCTAQVPPYNELRDFALTATNHWRLPSYRLKARRPTGA